LSIVKHLVELHGGIITAHSEGEGKGATFSVQLPLTTTRPVNAGVRPREARPTELHTMVCPPSLAGKHVLLVDDEADTREMLQDMLESCGVRVSVAASAAEGLEVLKRSRPDVLVSDIGMPGEDGYTFIQKVRQLPPSEGGLTPAVALTAYARWEDRRQALVAGFTQHVSKPVEPTELLLLLASVAGRPALS
ncbi:response regulator, partial [Hyalangium sp.]|uniref:response regulator n=1 Tax=Hyalangium sp. TaxID=2028555 RepID=UPI002D2738F3